MPNYNNIVWIYDFLSKMVFGKKQDYTNKLFLGEIPAKARVLVVGGGTGKIIEYLNDLERDLEVDYVDISSKMIARSKRRANKSLKLSFYCQSIIDFTGQDYDVIIANFFFDQLPQKIGQKIAINLRRKLNKGGFIIFSDFIETKNLWDRFILAAMISFFRFTANLNINCLPDYGRLFRQANLIQVRSSHSSRNIISSIIYPI